MDALYAALSLSDIPSVSFLLARLPDDDQTTLRAILPRTPLLQMLHHLQTMALRTTDLGARRTLLDVARLAVVRHPHTAALFDWLSTAIAAPSVERAAEIVAVSKADALLSLEMLALASELLRLAGLEDKGRFCYHVALVIADRFELTLNRGIVLHQLGLYEHRGDHFAAAEDALSQAAVVLKHLQPSIARASQRLRAQNYAERLRIETAAPLPPTSRQSSHPIPSLPDFSFRPRAKGFGA